MEQSYGNNVKICVPVYLCVYICVCDLDLVSDWSKSETKSMTTICCYFPRTRMNVPSPFLQWSCPLQDLSHTAMIYVVHQIMLLHPNLVTKPGSSIQTLSQKQVTQFKFCHQTRSLNPNLIVKPGYRQADRQTDRTTYWVRLMHWLKKEYFSSSKIDRVRAFLIKPSKFL